MTKRIAAVVFACLLCMTGCSGLTSPQKEDQAAALLNNLTLEQKIGQMLMPAFRTWTDESGEEQDVTELNEPIAQAIQTYGFGGVILFAENTAGTASTTELICDMQSAAASSESGLPLLMSVDQEGGAITRLHTGTTLCGNMALGATGKPALAKQAATLIGSELAAEGFHVDFAPVMDVNNNPDNPVIGVRSFSDDPEQTAKYGKAFLSGLHKAGIAAAIKHFPGHGDTETDSHSGLPCINKSREELESCEWIPFESGIRAGADIVMTAHIQYPQIEQATYVSKETGESVSLPATLSKTIITDILRGDMGYDSVVCTDSMVMDAIASNFDSLDAARYAINAGVDILLMPVTMTTQEDINACGAYIQGIVDMMKAGEIEESTIDAAVTRILKLKIQYGLLDTATDKETQVQNALAEVGSEQNHAAEWNITEKAITVVKNEDNMLPLQVSENGKVALFCSYSNEVLSMEYAISKLKSEGVLAQDVDCQVYCYEDASVEDYADVIDTADAVIASVETYSAANLDASNEKKGWQAAFLDALIERTHANGTKIAVISLYLPYDLARYQQADALLAAYSAEGMEETPQEYTGETVTYGANLPTAVCAAFGAFSPSGTLPVNIPELDEQNAYTDAVLYARGYGLHW